MPWIRVIGEEDATGDLKKVYEEIQAKRGKISNIMRVHSLSPKIMLKHMGLYLALMFESSGLSREEREMLGVVVSQANRCDYCVKHHAIALNHYWKDEEKTDKLASDFESVDLPGRQYHMLKYARKLAMTSHEVTQEDVQALRENGLNDSEILNVNLIAGYFCFVNRIVLGLGVESTADESEGYKY
jgi:uncharacterized peroxidase-related enzyme